MVSNWCSSDLLAVHGVRVVIINSNIRIHAGRADLNLRWINNSNIFEDEEISCPKYLILDQTEQTVVWLFWFLRAFRMLLGCFSSGVRQVVFAWCSIRT